MKPDIIFIEQLEVSSVIGIYDWEREIRQRICLDIEMAVDLRAAACSDTIDDTVSYSEVAAQVTALVENSQFQLLEALAEAVAQLILRDFAVSWLKLTVHKPGAVANARSVGVRIERGSTNSIPTQAG